jgi:hypothetical protein
MQSIGATEAELKSLFASYKEKPDVDEEDFKANAVFPIARRLKAEKEKASPIVTSSEAPQDEKLNQETLEIRKAMGRPRRVNMAQKPLTSDGTGKPSGASGTTVPKPQNSSQPSTQQETKATAQSPLPNADKEKTDYFGAFSRAQQTISDALNAVKGNPGPNASLAGKNFIDDLRAMKDDVTNNRYGDALKKLGVLEPVARQILAAQTIDNLAAQPTISTADKEKADYEAAYLRAKPLNTAAMNVVKGKPGPNASLAAATFLTDFRAMHADATNNRYADALKKLGALEPVARQLLTAKGRDDAVAQKEKQLGLQKAQFDAMAPTLTDVKRSYLPDGAADHIGENHTGKEAEFKSFLAALKQLEASKKGIDPKTPVPKQQAKAIKALCDSMIVAAQAYLALDPKSGKPDEIVRKEKICEEHIKVARQYGIAMVLDEAGKPDAKNPWDLETQAKAMGALAAFSYEQGYQQATGLGGDAGASDSFWIKHKDIDKQGAQVTNKRGDFIFKPLEGEENPTGMRSPKGAGSIKEALASSNANLFAAQTGIDLGVPPTSVVSVGGFAVEGKNPSDPPSIGSVQQHAGASTMIKDLPKDMLAKVKREDIHKIALLDIMSLSMDRHDGNIMVNTDDPDNPGLVPIDHGGTLPARADFSATKSRMGGVDVGFTAKVVNTLLRFPAAYEKLDDETVAKLELLDPAAMEQGMKDQRDALGKVHPGLDPGGKVGDDSFNMSKRSMMFLKRAAKALSPAEIQIALAAHGEALFDAADEKAFNLLVDKVISEQAPKKAGYQEIMMIAAEERDEIAHWLGNNGWKLLGEDGVNSSGGLLLLDPVNALKLYKAQKTNPAPVSPPGAVSVPQLPKQTVRDSAIAPDQTIKDEIATAFPGINRDGSDDDWKKNAFYWTEINKIVVDGKTGMAAYKAACVATGAAISEKSMLTALKDLAAWQELNTKENATVLAGIDPSAGAGQTVDDVRKSALRSAASVEQLAAAATAGSLIDPSEAIISNVNILYGHTAELTSQMTDKARAAKINKVAAGVIAILKTGDLAKLESEMRSFYEEALHCRTEELRAEAIVILDRIKSIIPTYFSPPDAVVVLDLVAQAKDSASTAGNTELNQLIIDWNSKETDMRKQPVQSAPVDKTAATSSTNPAPDNTTDTAATQAPPRPTLDPPVPIPAFAWSQSASSASKKAAVKAKLFKDKDTGLTSALDKVLEARKKIEGMKPTLANDKKITTLEKAIEEYNKFGIFVASKLRGLSGNAGWMKYCDEAAKAMQKEVTDLRATIDQITKNQTGT